MPKKKGAIANRNPCAPDHGELKNNGVHIFVDDQNLFWGITNDNMFGKSFRIDFGLLLLEAAKDRSGNARPVLKAYIAGVIPDDDYFWEVAKNQGFQVKRGYLGANNRSKQDDSYLITEIVSTIYEKEGPSTVVLLAGDADYKPPLEKVLEKGWRSEIAFIGHGVSSALDPVTHEYREIQPTRIQKQRF